MNSPNTQRQVQWLEAFLNIPKPLNQVLNYNADEISDNIRSIKFQRIQEKVPKQTLNDKFNDKKKIEKITKHFN